MTQRVKIKRLPGLMGGLVLAITLGATAASADDKTISLSGNFGEFINLGATAEEVRALGPDRVEPEAADGNRVASAWHYFNNRGVRVRVCEDDQRVGAINAAVTPATQQYITEAGVRIGDNLEQTAEAYGNALQMMPETEGAIWFVDAEENDNRLTFGFNAEGEMTWVALGALRANGWTCGLKMD